MKYKFQLIVNFREFLSFAHQMPRLEVYWFRTKSTQFLESSVFSPALECTVVSNEEETKRIKEKKDQEKRELLCGEAAAPADEKSSETDSNPKAMSWRVPLFLTWWGTRIHH
jgi:hypothetical protein